MRSSFGDAILGMSGVQLSQVGLFLVVDARFALASRSCPVSTILQPLILIWQRKLWVGIRKP
jgi:hypothetical protein